MTARCIAYVLAAALALVLTAIAGPARAGDMRMSDPDVSRFPSIRVTLWTGWNGHLPLQKNLGVLQSGDHGPRTTVLPIMDSNLESDFDVIVHVAGRLSTATHPATCICRRLQGGRFQGIEHRPWSVREIEGEIDQVADVLEHIVKADRKTIQALIVNVTQLQDAYIRMNLGEWLERCQTGGAPGWSMTAIKNEDHFDPRDFPVDLALVLTTRPLPKNGWLIADQGDVQKQELVPFYTRLDEAEAAILESVKGRLYKLEIEYRAYDAASLGEDLEVVGDQLRGSFEARDYGPNHRRSDTKSFTLPITDYVRRGLETPDRLGTALRGWFARCLSGEHDPTDPIESFREQLVAVSDEKASVLWDRALSAELRKAPDALLARATTLAGLLFDGAETKLWLGWLEVKRDHGTPSELRDAAAFERALERCGPYLRLPEARAHATEIRVAYARWLRSRPEPIDWDRVFEQLTPVRNAGGSGAVADEEPWRSAAEAYLGRPLPTVEDLDRAETALERWLAEAPAGILRDTKAEIRRRRSARVVSLMGPDAPLEELATFLAHTARRPEAPYPGWATGGVARLLDRIREKADSTPVDDLVAALMRGMGGRSSADLPGRLDSILRRLWEARIEDSLDDTGARTAWLRVGMALVRSGRLAATSRTGVEARVMEIALDGASSGADVLGALGAHADPAEVLATAEAAAALDGALARLAAGTGAVREIERVIPHLPPAPAAVWRKRLREREESSRRDDREQEFTELRTLLDWRSREAPGDAAACRTLTLSILGLLSRRECDDETRELCRRALEEILRSFDPTSTKYLIQRLPRPAWDRSGRAIQRLVSEAFGAVVSTRAGPRDGEGLEEAEAAVAISRYLEPRLGDEAGFEPHLEAVRRWRWREITSRQCRELGHEANASRRLPILEALSAELASRPAGVDEEQPLRDLGDARRAVVVDALGSLADLDPETLGAKLPGLAPGLQRVYMRLTTRDASSRLRLVSVLALVAKENGEPGRDTRASFARRALDGLVRTMPGTVVPTLVSAGGAPPPWILEQLKGSILDATGAPRRDVSGLEGLLRSLTESESVPRDWAAEVRATVASRELETCARDSTGGGARWDRVAEILPDLLRDTEVRRELEGSMTGILLTFGEEFHRTVPALVEKLTENDADARAWLRRHAKEAESRATPLPADGEGHSPDGERGLNETLLLGLGGMLILGLTLLTLIVRTTRRRRRGESEGDGHVRVPDPAEPPREPLSAEAEEVRRLLSVAGFTDLRHVSEGRKSQVFLGFTAVEERILKVLAPRHRGNRVLRERFVEEGACLQEIWMEWAAVRPQKRSFCPVVRCHDVGYAGGLVYLALEHVRGETLDEVLSARSDLRLSSLASLHLTRRLAQALSVVHEIGLRHGDLRPGNVLIPAGGALSGRVQRAKILDFGSRAAHPDSHPAGDIRALGALLLRTLSGCEPPLGRTVEDGMLRDWLSDQPEAVVRLIGDMMGTPSDSAGRRAAEAVVRRIDRILESAGR